MAGNWLITQINLHNHLRELHFFDRLNRSNSTALGRVRLVGAVRFTGKRRSPSGNLAKS
jgi:hypothetical protein